MGRKTGAMRRIARERMEVLFSEAGRRARVGRQDLARRYCHMARRISMRYNVPLRPGLRRSYCRRCGEYLLPGRTSVVRLRRGRLNVRCTGCGRVMRFPLKGTKEAVVTGPEEPTGQGEGGESP